ncbi:MAG TPA: DNA polymerase III subunit gamma/tau [Flavipsychrobacter sp.]|nr:DNA polymerase III subunit gamma/tau [Flavipsychrobacter sp.]
MSEQYIVSARKYRPQTFDTVVGQEHITTTLKNAIRNQHLAHAYLFCGPRGVGKTTCARILAKTINCETPTADMEACGSCPTCKSFSDSTSFNIFELDAASNNSVDDIRELVNQVRFAPQQGKYKIYIIDEVHMLSAAAFNAFLKTLEEPPPYAIFILATTEKHKILPTILSRCQIFDFKRITTIDIVDHLRKIAVNEGMAAQDAALHVLAQKSEGCMRDALSMLDRIAGFTEGLLTYNATMEHLNMLDADFYFNLTDHLLSQDVSGSLLLLNDVLEKGFEGNVIIEGMEEHMRNLLLCKDGRMAKLLDVPDDHKPVYFEKANQTPSSFIISALALLNECELNYKNSSNKRLHVEMCMIRLCYLLQATRTAGTALPPEQKKKPDVTVASSQQPVAALHASPVIEVPVKAVVPAEHPVAISSPPSPAPASAIHSHPLRRINKGIMANLDELVNAEVDATAGGKKRVTNELLQQLYEQYKEQLRDERKSVYHSQFIRIPMEMISEEEIRFVIPDEIAESFVLEQRNYLSEYFKQHTGSIIRITTEIKKDENAAHKQEIVLSKQEIYDVMAAKNPQLAVLRNALNLHIDF